MRVPKVTALAVLAVLAMSLTGCGGESSSVEARVAAGQKALDRLTITAIERKWHDAETTRNLGEMMSLWAPNATWQLDPTQTLVGKRQIRTFWIKQVFPLAKKQHWFSDTATFRIRTSVDGDRGTLYFECHEIDRQTQKVVAVVGQDLDVARIGGRWLITKSIGSSPTLGA
jgi:ketosteroid isomerase-like protein